MLNFYILRTNLKFQTLSGKLSWSHYIELLPIKDLNKIKYLIMITENQNLSVRELRDRIKTHEYERLDDNTKLKLINNEKENINDFIKNPIVIKNRFNTNFISEKC